MAEWYSQVHVRHILEALADCSSESRGPVPDEAGEVPTIQSEGFEELLAEVRALAWASRGTLHQAD